MTNDLYAMLKNAGLQIDNHASDLYVRPVADALPIIMEFERQNKIMVTKEYFTSSIDGERWIDLRFMYTPWWELRVRKAV
jgi:hypothetical protein